MRILSTRGRSVLIALTINLAVPSLLTAQDDRQDQPTWVVDVGVAAANALAGGLTAAVSASIHGDDLADAFLKGATGGGVVFLGKRMAVERFGGSGLLGREIAAIGSSVVANGGAGRGWLTEVWLPIGPAWVQVRPEARWRARLNVTDVATLIWAATRSELHFDVERSISNGAPVFESRGHWIYRDSRRIGGFTRAGVVVIGPGDGQVERVQRHENVHVIQFDYLMHTLSRPSERWAWGLVTDREIPLDLNLLPMGLSSLLHGVMQSEAELLELR